MISKLKFIDKLREVKNLEIIENKSDVKRLSKDFYNYSPILTEKLDECIDAGVKEFIFIISKKKLLIKKYFFNDNFYKKILKKKKDKRLFEEYKKIRRYQKMIKFVYQNKPRGTGDAVLKCKKFIKNKYF